MNTIPEITAAIALHFKSEKGKAWKNRIYLRKGYLEVNADLSINTNNVAGIAFSQGVAMQLRELGYNVPVRHVPGVGGKTVKI